MKRLTKGYRERRKHIIKHNTYEKVKELKRSIVYGFI